MTDQGKAYKATEPKTLEERIMSPCIPKSEAEWWSNREITRLRKHAEAIADAADNAIKKDGSRASLAVLNRRLHAYHADAIEAGQHHGGE